MGVVNVVKDCARHQQYCIDRKIKLNVTIVISAPKIGRTVGASVSYKKRPLRSFNADYEAQFLLML